MDAEVAALAMTGASSLIKLMTTDAWGKVKDLISRHLGKSNPESAAALTAELDETRAEIETAADRAQAIADADTYLRRRLARMVTSGVISGDAITLLVSDLSQLTGNGPEEGSSITMSATAINGGKVYQQGSGVQLNL